VRRTVRLRLAGWRRARPSLLSVAALIVGDQSLYELAARSGSEADR